MADTKTFMKLIQAMESSGGKDTRHPAMDSGIHAGDSAVGSYAIMPNSAKEMANRKLIGPSDDVIKNLPNDQVSSLLKENPELVKAYVQKMAERLMDKTQNDPGLGMVGWRYGHNMPLDKIKETAEDNPDYMDKVNQRIGEQHLQSEMPNILDKLSPPYKDEPLSRKRK